MAPRNWLLVGVLACLTAAGCGPVPVAETSSPPAASVPADASALDVSPDSPGPVPPDAAAPDLSSAEPDTAPEPDVAVEPDAPGAPDTAAAEPDVPAAPDLAPPDLAPAGAPNGSACRGAADCRSGRCVDGHCCDGPCAGACESCRVPGALGSCTPVPEGMDLDDECLDQGAASCGRDGSCNGQRACRYYPAGTECMPPSCFGYTQYSRRTCDGLGLCGPATFSSCPFACTNNACPMGCSAQLPCPAGAFCNAGNCEPARALGASCTAAEQCASNACIDGVCCNGACGGACEACNLPGSPGTCTAVPLGLDPASECPADPGAPCGRVGGCNGARACRLQAPGTSCGAASCTGTTETSAGTCDGLGACAGGTSHECPMNLACGPAACRTSCAVSSDCAPTYACGSDGASGTRCDLTAGLILHWRLDETSGSTAANSAPASLTGTYTGASGLPAPALAPTVAPLLYTNPASLRFTAASRHAVTISGALALGAPLRIDNNLTVAAWYRATSTDNSGGEILSAGDSYILRVRPAADGRVESSKRGNGAFRQCIVPVANAVNGQWHHLAGVHTPAGIVVYYDGVAQPACTGGSLGENIQYTLGQDFWIGRHGNPSSGSNGNWDFDGHIDDVRVYARALSAAEIAQLAQGRR
jgi:hypothetical protein